MHLLIIVLGIVFYNNLSSEDNTPVVLVKKIYSPKLRDSIFLKKISWGLTYDNEIIVVSTSSSLSIEPNPKKEYVFLTSEIFYKVSNDSLYIYTSQSVKNPIYFKSRFRVIQKVLSNPEMMNLKGYENYKNKGLKVIE